MNVAELARRLKVNSNDLLEKLPAIGFDIGRKAIKVDDRLALKIIEVWKANEKKQREMTRIAEIRGGVGKDELTDLPQEIKEIKVPPVIVVRDLASLMDVPINKLLTALMKNGVLTSMNERIDFDTASIIGEELGFKVLEDAEKEGDHDFMASQDKLKEILTQENKNKKARPPVIVVMGHVDHGKTKILDAIRKTDVVSGESGGITQHIGAYQVRKNGRLLTFIDTPGHEAFTAMRSRGAKVADIAILVVAADDSIQPQTKEAIKIIQDAKIPFVVAINKIDKPEADIEKVKQDLSSNNLLPEDWGGKVICVPVSAKDGTGIEDLLDTVILVADMEKESIMADPDRLAIGTIVESHIDKGEGPVATILVQTGTLHLGDFLCASQNYCGKVRALKDYQGDSVEEAPPGMPVKILGLKIAPEVGSIMEVVADIKELNRDTKNYKAFTSEKTAKAGGSEEKNEQSQTINLIIKADVLGSLEAIVESLAKMETDKVRTKIISKGLGIITEADVLKAEAANALILGFHVKPAGAVANLARDKKVEIKFYEVIYHLLEEVKELMKELEIKETVKKLIGKLEVIKVFRHEANNKIVGGRVVDGTLEASDIVIVVRGGEAVSSGKVTRIECSRQQVEKAASGTECGVSFEGKGVLETGDILEFYKEIK